MLIKLARISNLQEITQKIIVIMKSSTRIYLPIANGQNKLNFLLTTIRVTIKRLKSEN